MLASLVKVEVHQAAGPVDKGVSKHKWSETRGPDVDQTCIKSSGGLAAYHLQLCQLSETGKTRAAKSQWKW